MDPPTAIIVGAGVGGIAIAARLSKKGYRVTVVEKNAEVGGRCSLLHDNGYRFDQGPSLLLMPTFFHQIFHDLNTSMSAEGITLKKCTPNYRIWYPDLSTLDLTTDLTTMKSQIESHEGPHGFESFLHFLLESGHHHTLSCEHVLHRNFPSLWSMLRLDLLLALPSLHPFESIYSRASKYFHSEKLRQAFTFASMYLGMSPFDAPGTYSLLQYSELVDGIWYPVGGFRTILDALMRISMRYNTTYLMNTTVSSIELTPDQRTATGVRLADNTLLTGDIVIVNADLTYAYNNLLPKTSYGRSLTKRETSCSAISFFWSLDTTVPTLQAHNVFLATEYKISFDAIFKRNEVPEEPSFYIHIPSKIDSSAAPEGRDAMVVLVPVGHLPSSSSLGISAQEKEKDHQQAQDQKWNPLMNQIRTKIHSRILSSTGINLTNHIIHEKIETPLTWQTKYNLDSGAILGLSHSFLNVLCFRPRIQHQHIQGLFFVGASTHPGSGVPVVLSGSGITCSLVEGEMAKKRKGRGKMMRYGLVVVMLLVLLLVPVVVLVMSRSEGLFGVDEL
ncbi:phytoene desaturase [Aspergillus sclerotioniger CBS 115572]|uniref:Phytoene desaturase n=1 Tax=Aspergillus sclerotioniger CBS 115572 TaxID=1450535 RepID=A0A317XGS5_9EURO|nr:phytoene desaturase [Aspergillus sclerotioniger CBS 115572]PWY96190.1 phytoene desaturase [Aspergillus sclerotioniger CBS 115572]